MPSKDLNFQSFTCNEYKIPKETSRQKSITALSYFRSLNKDILFLVLNLYLMAGDFVSLAITKELLEDLCIYVQRVCYSD